MNNRAARVWWIIVGVLAVFAFPGRAAQSKGVFRPAPSGIPGEQAGAAETQHGPLPDTGRTHARAMNGRPEASSLIPLVLSAALLFWARRRGAFGRAVLAPIRVARPARPCHRSELIRD